MMNKETRRLSKIPDEVRGEIGSYFVDSPPLVDDDSRKLPKLDENTAEHIRTGLTVSSRLLLLNIFRFSYCCPTIITVSILAALTKAYVLLRAAKME